MWCFLCFFWGVPYCRVNPCESPFFFSEKKRVITKDQPLIPTLLAASRSGARHFQLQQDRGNAESYVETRSCSSTTVWCIAVVSVGFF